MKRTLRIVFCILFPVFIVIPQEKKQENFIPCEEGCKIQIKAKKQKSKIQKEQKIEVSSLSKQLELIQKENPKLEEKSIFQWKERVESNLRKNSNRQEEFFPELEKTYIEEFKLK